MKKIIICIVLLLICPMLVNAACTNADLSQRRALVNNVNVIYEYRMENNIPVFYITVNNLTSDMVLIDGNLKVHKGFSDSGSELIIKTTNTGRYKLEIYSYKCKESMGVKALNLPKYNKYYSNELCVGLEKYPLCQKWSNYVATEEQFAKDIKKIQEDEKKKEEIKQEQNPKEKNFFDKALDLFMDFWWVPLVIVIVSAGIYYFVKNKQKKNEYDFKL